MSTKYGEFKKGSTEWIMKEGFERPGPNELIITNIKFLPAFTGMGGKLLRDSNFNEDIIFRCLNEKVPHAVQSNSTVMQNQNGTGERVYRHPLYRMSDWILQCKRDNEVAKVPDADLEDLITLSNTYVFAVSPRFVAVETILTAVKKEIYEDRWKVYENQRRCQLINYAPMEGEWKGFCIKRDEIL